MSSKIGRGEGVLNNGMNFLRNFLFLMVELLGLILDFNPASFASINAMSSCSVIFWLVWLTTAPYAPPTLHLSMFECSIDEPGHQRKWP